MDEARPFSVVCDWCASPMVGEIRREQAGQTVVVQMPHADPNGQACQGSGRGVPTWPLRVVLRAVGEGWELRIGRGSAMEFSSAEALVARLRELGVDREESRRRMGSLKPGEEHSFDVPERRRETRKGTLSRGPA